MDPRRLSVVYWDCMRNHAVELGGYAVDGCGAFALDRARPESYYCEACGCHRSFHRLMVVEWQAGDHVEDEDSSVTASSPAETVEGPPNNQQNANRRRPRRSQRIRARGPAATSG